VAAAISVVVEADRAKPLALANMLTAASGAITGKLAPQPGQRLAAAARRQPGYAPVAAAAGRGISAPV
ncbi:MAG TPA: hypothetical protein VEL03_01815, partial [Streptosporangiaceae bacterium]|nr:hypothetical protein [Streptosporangiaceae bacterium]